MCRNNAFNEDIEYEVYYQKNPKEEKISIKAKNSICQIMRASLFFNVVSVNFIPLLLGNICLVKVKYSTFVDLVPVF